ncbi:MAG: CHAT domain-containing protein [Candidatus Aminicenantes bacterium]|nr:MAG: CHAT domain-containing protein [Candidatus Aminicenantes bacterium]
MKNSALKSREVKKLYICTFISLLFLTSQIYSWIITSQDNSSVTLTDRFLQLLQKAEELQKNGEFEKAIEEFNELRKIANKISEKEKECDTLIKLGLLYWNIGRLKLSSQYYSYAQSIANKNGLKELGEQCQNALKIYSFYNQGKKYRSSGDAQKSIENFENAISLSRSIQSKEHELKCLRVLSSVYWKLNDFQNFYVLNKNALEIAQILNHRREQGKCLNNIGIFHKNLNNYSEALNSFSEALRIANELNNLNDESDISNNIGNIYKNIGNYEKALDFLKRALEIDRELGNTIYIAIDLINLGDTLRNKGLISDNKEDMYMALTYFEDCLKLTELSRQQDAELDILNIIEVRVLNNLGSVNTDLENYYQALEYFQRGYQKAEEIQDLESIGMILNNMGIVHFNQGNYEESTKYYQRAIDLAQELEGGQILWEAFFEIGNSYAKQNKIFEALKNYKNSIRIIENIRSQIKLEELKASYLGTDKRIEAYQNLIHMLVTLHNSDNEVRYDKEAFNYLERAKARSFLDSLEVAQVDISLGINFKLKNREKEIMKDISNIYNSLLVTELTSEDKEKLHQELTAKENELETLKREIRSKSPDYADLRYPEIISLEETQKQLLNSKTVFFAYIVGNQYSYGFAISKNDIKIFPIPAKSELQDLVAAHLQIITDKDSSNFKLGKDLFEILVHPGLDDKTKKMIFIPDDVLHFLPFETLLTQQNTPHWLIEDYKIAYAPSISSYREIIRRKDKDASRQGSYLLAFGDPDFGPMESETDGEDIFQNFYSSNAFNFYRLKYSGTEIDRISSLFKQKRTDVFIREEATEEQLKNLELDKYKIIHFATHSLIDDKKPARSSIVLSLGDDTEEDGFVQMREIYNLKLNADLVTLSACQTGLGQYIRGEGIEGLNRAFFFAGSSSVLMSLWAVNDQATYQLMERFYTHLRSSKQIASSLRKAKLEMIASDAVSHPYYWAGFIVTGKSDHVLFSRFIWKWIIFGGSCLALGSIFFLAARRNGHLARHP